MKRVKLGWRGPLVSQVCFGSLAVSPLQGRVNFAEGVEVLRYALAQGIDWIDTAEIYDNYMQIAQALREKPEVRVVSKSYAVTASEMAQSIEKARLGLDRDVIDFFLLHEQESAFTLKGHQEAWEELLRSKEKGLVGGIGISTHAVAGVRAGALLPGIDLIHPIINREGLGIIDGSREDMLEAIDFAGSLGIGIYAMKVFGGGHLSRYPKDALSFALNIPGIHALALGMSNRSEIDYNLKVIAGDPIPPELADALIYWDKKLVIAEWCQGCGRCVERCPQGALYFAEDADAGSSLQIDRKACVLCGYCGRACPHFCLKIV